MAEYIEPNRDDADACPACYHLETSCDWHAGVVHGADTVALAVGTLASDPYALLTAATEVGSRQLAARQAAEAN